MPHFAGVKLTDESVAAARRWYCDNFHAMKEEAESGAVRMNDLATYREWCERCAEQVMTDGRLSFALLQRAYYEQTGESVALLP